MKYSAEQRGGSGGAVKIKKYSAEQIASTVQLRSTVESAVACSAVEYRAEWRQWRCSAGLCKRLTAAAHSSSPAVGSRHPQRNQLQF